MPLNNAHGLAYEPHALSQYARAHPDRIVFCGKGGFPDAVLALVTGKPVTPEMTRELKREHTAAVNEALANGEEPPRLSEHFGMDGVGVDAEAWSMHKEDLLSSLHILECKVGLADCHILGPSIARQFTNLAIYGPKKLPPLTLISPHKPTPKVVDTFAPLPGAFHHELIREAPLVSSAVSSNSTGVVGDATTTETIDCFQWQKTVARRTVREWKKGNRLCVVNVVMGMGKTVAGWLSLQNADKWPLRLFCAHTTVVAGQVREEAMKLGITALDLTHLCKTKAGVDAAVRGAADFSSDSSSDGEPAPEEQEATAAECARLIHSLADLSRKACADKPVYAVLCHTTLRALAKHGFGDLGCRAALLIDESHKMKNCRVVYESLLSPSNSSMRTLLMTATPPKSWDVGSLGETIAKALVDAPVVMRLGLTHGIEMKRLVPTHVEVVVAADAESGEVCDSAEATIAKKAEATAAWIVSNNLSTVSVYATRIDDAKTFAAALGPAIDAIAGGKAWCASVHSKKKTSENDAALDHFKADTFSSDGVMHKVVVSVGQLKEGFNMPCLQAVVLLEPPDDAASVLQMAGRAMRVYPGKTMARMLVFGEDRAAASVGRMLHAYDREFKAVSVGAVANTYNDQINTATTGPIRTALEAKSRSFEASTRERLQNLALTNCDNSTLRTTQTAAFVDQFAETKPTQRGGQKLEYTIDGVVCRIDAGSWLNGVRKDWHKSDGGRVLSVANKAALVEGLGWFDPPPLEKTSFSHTQRVQQVHAFMADQKRMPNRVSSDAGEKALGHWLYTFLKNGSLGSERRVRNEAGDAAVDALLTTIAATPNAKQAADRTKALKNVEGLAHACHSLRGCEGRDQWPAQSEKPYGMFLTRLRTGQLGPDVQEEALAIIRRVLSDPLDATALSYLESSLSLSVSNNEECKRKQIERNAAKRGSKKRKVDESGVDKAQDEPASKRASSDGPG